MPNTSQDLFQDYGAYGLQHHQIMIILQAIQYFIFEIKLTAIISGPVLKTVKTSRSDGGDYTYFHG